MLSQYASYNKTFLISYLLDFSILNFTILRLQLQLFSLQILHCNNTFSAKGVTIDAKFLARVSELSHFLLII